MWGFVDDNNSFGTKEKNSKKESAANVIYIG